jgi:hypothetical protein
MGTNLTILGSISLVNGMSRYKEPALTKLLAG